MAAVDATLLPRQRNLILGALLLLAAGAWAVLFRQAAMSDGMTMGARGPTMGLAAPLFLAIWVLMMVAMKLFGGCWSPTGSWRGTVRPMLF